MGNQVHGKEMTMSFFTYTLHPSDNIAAVDSALVAIRYAIRSPVTGKTIRRVLRACSRLHGAGVVSGPACPQAVAILDCIRAFPQANPNKLARMIRRRIARSIQCS